MNRVRAIVDPLLARTSFTYESDGRPRMSISPLGFITTTLYDAEGRTRVVIDANSGRVSMGYDARDNLVTVQNDFAGSRRPPGLPKTSDAMPRSPWRASLPSGRLRSSASRTWRFNIIFSPPNCWNESTTRLLR